MKKLCSLNIGIMTTLAVVFYVAYYFLLQDNFLHISISSIIAYTETLDLKKHILVLGLLPIYIAIMVFGAAMIGVYLGSSIQQFLLKRISLGNKK